MGAGGEEEGGGGIGDYPCGHIRGEGEHGPSLSLWPFRCRLSLFCHSDPLDLFSLLLRGMLI